MFSMKWVRDAIKSKLFGYLNSTTKFNVPAVGGGNEQFRVSWLDRQLNAIPAGYKILDAGAGEGQFKRFCQHLNYFSQDFSQYDGLGDAGALQTGKWDTSEINIVSDICDIPVQAEFFDAVMCTEVLEHLPDPVKALSELARVLKRGGTLILTAPFCSLSHFTPFHFSSGFNKYFYIHHLNELGFEIVDISANGNFFEYLGQELKRLEFVSGKYTEIKMDSQMEYSRRVLLKYLEKMSRNDTGSDELLCFGYNVLARKL